MRPGSKVDTPGGSSEVPQIMQPPHCPCVVRERTMAAPRSEDVPAISRTSGKTHGRAYSYED